MTRTTPLTVGVALGTIGLEGDAWLRAASRLAVGPIDRLWIWDHLMGRGAPERSVLEATTLAAAALALSPNLHVGTLVLDVTKRHPALTAKIAATLDAIAPGRFTLGIGAGGDAAEHDALGMAYGLLYAILASEDHALLLGALTVFTALATLMVATRRFDWRRPAAASAQASGA